MQPFGIIRDSDEAFRAFSNQPENYDLIITDMTMPHMDGSRLSRNILSIRPDIPISKKNRKMFKAWDKADPIDAWDRKRAKRIERIQGNVDKFEH